MLGRAERELVHGAVQWEVKRSERFSEERRLSGGRRGRGEVDTAQTTTFGTVCGLITKNGRPRRSRSALSLRRPDIEDISLPPTPPYFVSCLVL